MVRSRRDDGAAAVEFALLVGLFLVIVFGLISAGFAFSRQITIRQASRESSRFGSTLPIPPDTGETISNWLAAVYDAALAAGGDTLSATTPTPGQFVCVAYVAGTGSGGGQPTVSLSSPPPADLSTLAPSPSPCWDDSTSGMATDPRVQVLIRRNTDWNTLFASGSITLSSRSVTPYERTVP